MEPNYNRDLWREGYVRGMAEGAAYKEAYFNLLDQLAKLQAMTPPMPMMVVTQPVPVTSVEVPRLSDEERSAIEDKCWDGPGFGASFDRIKYARDIEAALIAKWSKT